MARVVLDVNIIVSGFFRGKGAAVAIAKHWEDGNVDVAISDHIIDRVVEVWTRPFFLRCPISFDRPRAWGEVDENRGVDRGAGSVGQRGVRR